MIIIALVIMVIFAFVKLVNLTIRLEETVLLFMRADGGTNTGADLLSKDATAMVTTAVIIIAKIVTLTSVVHTQI